MITLQKIALINFLSHKQTVLEISEQDQIVLDGNSGSGKSSIFEAITWGLYGEGRASNTELIHKGAEKAEVYLYFFDGPQNYSLKRAVTNKGKQSLTVVCNGEELQKGTMRDLQAYLERDVYRASYLLFSNSVAYIQGNANTFVAQTATKRKELLLELAECGDFDDLYQRTRTVANNIQSEVISIQARLSTFAEIIKDRESVLAEEPEVTAKLQKVNEEILVMQSALEATKQKHYGLKNKIDTASATKGTIATLQAQIKEAEDLLATVATKAAEIAADEAFIATEQEIKERFNAVSASAEEITLLYNNAVAGDRERARILGEKPAISNYDAVITQLEKQRESLTSGKQCPAGDACPFMKEIVSQVAAVEASLTEIKGKQISETYLLQEWQQRYDAIPVFDMSHLEKRRNEVGAQMVSVNDELRRLDDASRRLLVSREQQTRAGSANLQLPALRTTLETLVKSSMDVTEYEKELAIVEQTMKQEETALLGKNAEKMVIEGRLALIENAKKDIVTMRADSESITKQIEEKSAQLNDLSVLQDAFGSKGIKTVVIDYILPTLEHRINTILSQMSEFQVQLSTQAEKTSGDGAKEGLFINIVNEMGEVMSFENYSGGEKLRIVIAISEALAGLQRFGFRLFDEALLSLDENSLEGLLRVLGQLLARFPQVMCISHITEVKEVFPRRVLVRKMNGVSVTT